MRKMTVMLFTMLSSALALAGEQDNAIGTIAPNYADQDCPVLITENSAMYCGSFKFADLNLQIPMAEALSKQGILRMVGEWEMRETGNGNSDIFVISFVKSE